MNYREEILKYISLEELEKEIQTKKTELKGLVSTEACEFIIANEVGLIEGKENRIKTVREGFEDALKHDYFDKGLYKYLDKEELGEIKINIDSEELKRKIEGYGKIDIDEIDIAFKNLEKALESDDTSENWLAFKRFQFWLALRQIPIKIADLYMNMGEMRFKNSRFRSYIFIDEKRLDIDYEGYYEFFHKKGDYAK